MRAQEGKLGILGLPGKIFHDHALQIVGKRPIFGEFAMKEANISTDWALSDKSLKNGFNMMTI